MMVSVTRNPTKLRPSVENILSRVDIAYILSRIAGPLAGRRHGKSRDSAQVIREYLALLPYCCLASLPYCQQYGRLSGGRRSNRSLLRLAGLKAVQIVNRPLRVAGGRENETLVALQHLQP